MCVYIYIYIYIYIYASPGQVTGVRGLGQRTQHGQSFLIST